MAGLQGWCSEGTARAGQCCIKTQVGYSLSIHIGCAWLMYVPGQEKTCVGSITPCGSLVTRPNLCALFSPSLTSWVFDACFLSLQTQLIQMVIWMLQHRLLIQLHTYVCLMVPPNEEEFRAQDEDMPFTARVGGRSLSTPNALSFGSPSMSTLFSALQPTAHSQSLPLPCPGQSVLE